MLIERTLFEDIDRVNMSIERIKIFEPKDGYYVAFSGGKDSIVALDLIRKSGVKHDAHMNMTSVDPPELVRFIRKYYPDVERHRPEMTMWKLIEEKMILPTRQVRYCCAYFKEGRGAGRIVVTGIRWEESNRRRQRKMVESCTKGKNTRYLHPIIDWSSKDVWQYIKENKLPYPSLYDEGFNRIGCIGCPNSNYQKEFDRWPRYEKLYRRACDRIYELRKQRGLEVKVDDGQDMFNWWVKKRKLTDPDQFTLFE
jgi:phosphoadenosine phosphosulfate reductase